MGWIEWPRYSLINNYSRLCTIFATPGWFVRENCIRDSVLVKIRDRTMTSCWTIHCSKVEGEISSYAYRIQASGIKNSDSGLTSLPFLTPFDALSPCISSPRAVSLNTCEDNVPRTIPMSAGNDKTRYDDSCYLDSYQEQRRRCDAYTLRTRLVKIADVGLHRLRYYTPFDNQSHFHWQRYSSSTTLS